MALCRSKVHGFNFLIVHNRNDKDTRLKRIVSFLVLRKRDLSIKSLIKPDKGYTYRRDFDV